MHACRVRIWLHEIVERDWRSTMCTDYIICMYARRGSVFVWDCALYENEIKSAICCILFLYWRFEYGICLTTMAAICFIFFKVGFGLERVVECVHICEFVCMSNFSILGEATILIWLWVQLWLWFAFVICFRVHRQLVVGLAYVGRRVNPSSPRNLLRDRLLAALFSNLRDAMDWRGRIQ